MRTWFITGGTPGGFGMAYAQGALDIGDRVVLTTRRADTVADWAHRYADRVLVLPLDVADPGEVRSAVATAEEHFGGIDVLVNNAGRGWHGSVEGMAETAVRAVFELNFFAVLSVTRAVLPGMRARGSGWIITMSSAAGLRPVPGFGYYSAAKHAIEAITTALRSEVAGLGIRVLTVEPGPFRTRAYAGFATEPTQETVAEYHAIVESVRSAMIHQDGRQPGDPRRGVQAVLAAMTQPTPPHRLILGNTAFDTITETLEHTLADIRANEGLSRSGDYPDHRPSTA
ncbi:SDR family NAD(P)-dependent oxidoreductase [Amycolatopsis panacis]|uniref:SDR family NAD(P)-dependent oxidoreductase n=1 Tax=Amycolatopsis panacis TaxID=2340917 RepID=A0A419I266_9PSEU|nr:SDR family NAD(P)-dependent oxidoreductase [Amycolatopsis panacis]RJQ83958.1 SDR family NAD(P)-dependent oxidoreductase [Amycolatopsis panacis]